MKKVKMDVITNSGVVTLDTEFEVLFSECNHIRIATAFISESTIKMIRDYLRKDIKKNNLRLLIGLYGGFNSKKDLRELVRLVRKYKGNLSVRISRNALFHWKYYSFSNRRTVVEFVGSSNFTSSGLTNPGELTLKLTGVATTREIKILNMEFEKLWNKDSIDLNDFPIDDYKSRRGKVIESSGFKIGSSITKLLYKPRRRKRYKLELSHSKCYLEVIDFTMTKSSERAILNKMNNWEKSNYRFICSNSKMDFKKWQNANYILEFENIKNRKRMSLNEVMDWCEFRTDDGKYFVAIKRLRGTGIRQLSSESTKKILKTIGLRNSAAQEAKWLNKNQMSAIFEYFGVK